jgi:hypothetical protein
VETEKLLDETRKAGTYEFVCIDRLITERPSGVVRTHSLTYRYVAQLQGNVEILT